MEDAREFVVAVDSFTLQGSTFWRDDRILAHQLGSQVTRLLNAGIIRPASSSEDTRKEANKQ